MPNAYLLTNDGSGTLRIDIEVASGMLQDIRGFPHGVDIFGEDGSGKGISRRGID